MSQVSHATQDDDHPLGRPLSADEQRVLGALLEKQVTVPGSYPLTLSALRTACNQTSSREPVTDLDERTVEQTARALKDDGLLRIVWSDSGRRTLKYHQALDEVLGLDEPGRALLTVLLLRGAQSPGELRTRTERLHRFTDRDDAEAALEVLAGRERPLVRRLDKRPGDRDHRWMHLLGPASPAAGAEGPVPLAADAGAEDGREARDALVREVYDALAPAYAEQFCAELEGHGLPFERWVLWRAAEHAAELGLPVVEVGSGPGHTTAYLAAMGADARGLDVSPGMVEEARARYPELRYDLGDLRRLMRPEAAEGWGAVVAWFSLHHLSPAELGDAVAALARPLAPGGLLVVGTFSGHEVRRVGEWLGHDVTGLALVPTQPEVLVEHVRAAGLVDVEWYVRGARPEDGERTDRLVVVARRA
ncbi:DUF480 domain-containing protein [Nocardioides sp. GY 10127]|uniref:DUF480 domain-containing protein n=1 Tax=Nocardioides sp. GY 10127 TaxID=2569762 RepID=UPI0010A7DBB6|nr:DUF480 domain-containing protein [Nocardioides sp. GY 10127]TIC86573.1 DUF480 domain-containing protein [Nocardioides sp. GY 10127]